MKYAFLKTYANCQERERIVVRRTPSPPPLQLITRHFTVPFHDLARAGELAHRIKTLGPITPVAPRCGALHGQSLDRDAEAKFIIVSGHFPLQQSLRKVH
jgi:hypothetical protein